MHCLCTSPPDWSLIHGSNAISKKNYSILKLKSVQSCPLLWYLLWNMLPGLPFQLAYVPNAPSYPVEVAIMIAAPLVAKFGIKVGDDINGDIVAVLIFSSFIAAGAIMGVFLQSCT